jgi:hypothetical protein
VNHPHWCAVFVCVACACARARQMEEGKKSRAYAVRFRRTVLLHGVLGEGCCHRNNGQLTNTQKNIYRARHPLSLSVSLSLHHADGSISTIVTHSRGVVTQIAIVRNNEFIHKRLHSQVSDHTCLVGVSCLKPLAGLQFGGFALCAHRLAISTLARCFQRRAPGGSASLRHFSRLEQQNSFLGKASTFSDIN